LFKILGDIFMNLINKLIMLGAITLSVLALNSRAFAGNDYLMSCTNTAYDGALSSAYLQAQGLGAIGEVSTDYGIYTGNDCVYSGAGRTNSSAIVGGEIARAAANSIIGAVNGRLSSALAMNNTAAHMSYTSNGNGIGMAANHLIGGLSIWTNFSSSSFDNDQTFTSIQLDSNNFDGDSSSMSVGIDKRFGNVMVGFMASGFDSDIDTKVNKGNITTEGETYGVYVGLNTGVVTLSLGAGTGEYDVTTRRVDFGSDKTITADKVVADVQYYHASLSGNISRGKLSFSPRIGYRNFDLDMPAFIDIVPSDANTLVDTTATGNESIAGKTYSSDMSEAGLSISLSTGKKLVPYVDIAYVHEDTSSAGYTTELTDDGTVADLAASAPDGYIAYGGGVILNLSSKVSGYLNFSETTNRSDFSETSISGSLKLQF
jgi:hypothetical protein